jgi:TIR domain
MTANKARKTATRQRMAETGEPYSVARRATALEAVLNPEALARGHKLFVVPVQRTDEFPWYEIPDQYLDRGFEDEHAILQFSGFWKGSGPQWSLYTDDVYDDDVYQLGGEPEDPPISEAIEHLNRVRQPIAGIRSSVPVGHAFISYVREDSPEVDRLQRMLEAAGVRVWRDTAELWPGEDWRAKIRHAITDDAFAFLACFSRQSLAREKSYQRQELNLAIEEMQLRSRNLST